MGDKGCDLRGQAEVSSSKIFIEHLLHARHWQYRIQVEGKVPVLTEQSCMGMASVKCDEECSPVNTEL